MVSQAGTIDGINYSSSQNVYDGLGDGIVTHILYVDQSGAQVADRRLFFDLGPTSYIGVGPKMVNSDGSFSVEFTQPGSGGGIPQGDTVDTFSSAGILTRQDNYIPIYITSPSGMFEGTAGTTDSYTLFNATGPGSSGKIGGVWYDMVATQYDTGGQAIERDYYNDLNATQTIIAKQILASPDPIFTVPTAATAIAGAPQALPGIRLTDEWASLNPGTLALIVSVDSGTLSGYDDNGNPYTATAGSPARFTGTLSQINADLNQLSFTGQAGTAHISFQIYDQAGVTASAQETVTVGPDPSSAASTPNPILTGVTQISTATNSPLSLNGVTFSDPWAASHAGTLALNVTTNFGSLSEVSGTVTSSGAALHAVGTAYQIGNDLAGLVLTSGQPGTATVRVEVYDQAGIEAVHLVGVSVHA